MKRFTNFAIIVGLFLSLPIQAQDSSLKLHYTFSGSDAYVADQSGNNYNGILKNGAVPEQLGSFYVLNLGSQNGYIDLTPTAGNLIKTLSDFSIALYIYVEPHVDLTQNGNFICTFANSDDMARTANGNMFLIAKNTRYAISSTHWQNETTVSANSDLEKGTWKHLAYTQEGNTGRLFIDGAQVQTYNRVFMKPQDLGETGFNFIGRSCYASDVYLNNSYLSDFRMYSRALSANEIVVLSSKRASLNSAMNQKLIDELEINGLDSVTTNLSLPASFPNGMSISWQSSNTAVISNTGTVSRPQAGSPPTYVVLTATFSKDSFVATRDYTAKVIPYLSDLESVEIDASNLIVKGNLTLLRSDLELPSKGGEGSSITWSSSAPSVLSGSGKIVSRPSHGSGNAAVILTAVITKGDGALTKEFAVTVAEDEGFAGYLFSYFTGNYGDQESIRFALSDDGFTFKALNNNNPIIPSSEISSTGGVRDPHILRGEDNDYYMVVTDMVSAWGWASNRAIVLLKSSNLVDWQSSVVNIPNTFPEYAAADRVWAPQTIFDPETGKYMVYFSMRLGPSDYDKIYYAYANSSFTALESAPKLLFENNGKSVIDGDIVFFEGEYHLFFKTEGSGNGIKKAVSESLTSGYVLYDNYLQATTAAVEGGCVYRMYNSDKWMMIYDMYTSGAYQFTESYDLKNFTVTPNPVSFDFAPRHGTIIPITPAEKQALLARWDGTGTGICKNIEAKPFLIYPNPAGTRFFINTKNESYNNLNFRLKDYAGRIIYTGEIKSNIEEINITELPNGLYLFSIFSGNRIVQSNKIIIAQ